MQMGGWAPVWDMGKNSSSYMFFTINAAVGSSYTSTAYEICRRTTQERTDTLSLSISYNTW
jgi:hypothetical protein